MSAVTFIQNRALRIATTHGANMSLAAIAKEPGALREAKAMLAEAIASAMAEAFEAGRRSASPDSEGRR